MINTFQTAYTEMYERSLVDDLRDETSGDFKHLLLALINGNRDELFEVDEDAAQADAQAIYDVGNKWQMIGKIYRIKCLKAGEGRWYGTDEDEFTKILATRSYLQLRIIFEKYAEVCNKLCFSSIFIFDLKNQLILSKGK